MLIIFCTEDKEYCGSSALEIVRKLEASAADYPYGGQPLRNFLNWSLNRLRNCIPPREMDLSNRMKEEELALNYLYLRDEYGAGKLLTDAEMKL